MLKDKLHLTDPQIPNCCSLIWQNFYHIKLRSRSIFLHIIHDFSCICFWHLENQLLFLFNYISETVKNTVMGFKEYSGQNTEDSTSLQY